MSLPPTRCARCGLRLESVTVGEHRHVYTTSHDRIRELLMHERWSWPERAWVAAQLLRSGVSLPGPHRRWSRWGQWIDTGERDALGNVIVQGCPFPEWCRFAPGPMHRHSIIDTSPRAVVVLFADAMEAQLAANDHKGGWRGISPAWLLTRLVQELGELRRAVTKYELYPGHRAAVVREAADVANFAMMIADVVQADTGDTGG